jgi:hypothetical protein
MRLLRPQQRGVATNANGREGENTLSAVLEAMSTY